MGGWTHSRFLDQIVGQRAIKELEPATKELELLSLCLVQVEQKRGIG
jgi:hypothetical protein